MDLIKMAAELFMKNANGDFDLAKVISAFQELMPTDGGEIDLTTLISKFAQNDMSGLMNSFLGDGANDNMNAQQILSIFGQDKIGSFADKVGVGSDEAASTLSDIIPQLIDQNSQGGALGGIAGQLMGGLLG